MRYLADAVVLLAFVMLQVVTVRVLVGLWRWSRARKEE